MYPLQWYVYHTMSIPQIMCTFISKRKVLTYFVIKTKDCVFWWLYVHHLSERYNSENAFNYGPTEPEFHTHLLPLYSHRWGCWGRGKNRHQHLESSPPAACGLPPPMPGSKIMRALFVRRARPSVDKERKVSVLRNRGQSPGTSRHPWLPDLMVSTLPGKLCLWLWDSHTGTLV